MPLHGIGGLKPSAEERAKSIAERHSLAVEIAMSDPLLFVAVSVSVLAMPDRAALIVVGDVVADSSSLSSVTPK